jgi:ectoine hydroxylase-related dioxygenase (phytanoyl-CoA dioxygenase family)
MTELTLNEARLQGEIPEAEWVGALRETDPGTPADEIRRRFAAEAYVCVPGFFGEQDVLAVRRAVFTKLATAGEIHGASEEGIYAGSSKRRERIEHLDQFWREISEEWALRRVTHSRALHEFCDILLEESSIAHDFVFLRVSNYGRKTLVHSDHGFFTRSTDNVITAWIAFGEIPLQMGPLFILENSHKHPRVQESIRDFDVVRDSDRKASWSETPLEIARQFSCRVLTRHMRPGDLVVFGMQILHGSLDNVDPDQRIRLTCDVRYQPRSEPRDPRYFGPDPGGTTGQGYGELVGAIPLDEAWHIR